MNLARIASLARKLLQEIEGKELRSGLVGTPNRVARAYEELFDGYQTDIDSLFTTFDGEAID